VAAQIDFPSRIGVWWTSDTWSMPDAQQAARDIEAMGYGSLFYGVINQGFQANQLYAQCMQMQAARMGY